MCQQLLRHTEQFAKEFFGELSISGVRRRQFILSSLFPKSKGNFMFVVRLGRLRYVRVGWGTVRFGRVGS